MVLEVFRQHASNNNHQRFLKQPPPVRIGARGEFTEIQTLTLRFTAADKFYPASRQSTAADFRRKSSGCVEGDVS